MINIENNKKDLNILIVGSGNIGRRHLEALIKSQLQNKIFVVEPSLIAIEETQKLVEEKGRNKKIEIKYFKSLSQIKLLKNISLAIIATNSYERLNILKELLLLNVKTFLLEKILFSSIKNLNIAKKLIDEKNATAYVNYCYRYTFPFNKIRHLLFGNKISMVVELGKNGLITNLPHWIDIFSTLTGENILYFKLKKNFNFFDSKRGRPYLDILGEGDAITQSGSLLNIKTTNKYQYPKIKIKDNKKEIVINEKLNLDQISEMSRENKFSFNTPMVSKTSGDFLFELINNSPRLPILNTIFENEKSILEEIEIKMKEFIDSKGNVPVT